MSGDERAGDSGDVAAASARPYISIGEVLDALRPEFPELTISKVRFFESQGLLEPERTLSGYRKFYPADVSRLRWILQQQQERYVPLKEIRAALVAAQASGTLPKDMKRSANTERTTSPPAAPQQRTSRAGHDAEDEDEATHRGAPPAALGEARHPASRARDAVAVVARETSEARPAERTRSARPPTAPAPAPAAHDDAPGPPTGSANPMLTGGTGASLTIGELASASGLAIDDIRLLEQFGLVVGRQVFSATYYDEDALVAARAAAAFRAFGVEPRHLRMYRTAADREADFFSQVVSPLLHRRRAEGREEAARTLDELARLGAQLRVVALRQVLRAALDARG